MATGQGGGKPRSSFSAELTAIRFMSATPLPRRRDASNRTLQRAMLCATPEKLRFVGVDYRLRGFLFFGSFRSLAGATSRTVASFPMISSPG